MKLKIKNKKIFTGLSLVLFLGIIFLFPNFAHAGLGETVATVLGWVLYPIIWVLGKILIMLMYILIGVAQYNDFINSNAVTTGWTLVRDLCNMFFILILLIIAFATILKIEQYNLKTWLPKLILMAILINFSKLICGIFIDVAQVIMLTFVNAFKDMAGGNLTEMLGVTKILSFDQSNSGDVTGWTILGSIILALIFSIISVVVVLTMLVMLAMRIIMIWIYVVLSPAAYLMASFPQGQSYSQRWWSDFSKNLIVGPVLAFFIWLSFASLGGIEGSRDINKMKAQSNSAGGEATQENFSATVTEAGSQDNMTKFIISIGMLLGGLMIAQEMGGVAGSIAGKGMAKLQAMGTGTMNAMTKGVKRATGVERVQNAIKARQSMKEGLRQDRAQKDAGWANQKIGQAKQAVVAPVNKLGGKVGEGIKSLAGVSKKDIEDRKVKLEEAKQKKVALEDLKVKIESAKTEEKNLGIKKQRELNKADADFKNGKITQSELDQRKNDINNKYLPEETKQKQKQDDLLKDYNANFKSDEKSAVSDFNKIDLTKEFEERDEVVGQKEKDLSDSMRGAKNFGKFGNIAGNILTLGLKGKVQHAGNEDLDLASNYHSSQISKHKDGMKDDKEDELRKKMNDYSLSGHERAAATMTLMEKGKLTKEEARIKRDELQKTYGNDNKVMNQMDGSLAGDYQHLTQTFTDLRSTDSSKQDKAKEKIVKGIVGGTIKLENIDKDSMKLIMPGLVKTMSNKNFKGKFDDLTKDKQREVKESLKSSGDYDSLKKLAGIQDGNLDNFDEGLDPVKNEESKVKFLGEIEFDEVKKMVSKGESIESLKKMFDNPTHKAIQDLKNAINEEDFKNKLNSILENSKLNSEVPTDRAVIKAFQEIAGVNFSSRRASNNQSNNQSKSGDNLDDKDQQTIDTASAMFD
ncbi:MAG TPA: hypothetical protein PK686_02255 [bacterium]|nr:hypothetical protein [bacterium]HPV65484.1 hypothetical protein [bacterium]